MAGPKPHRLFAEYPARARLVDLFGPWFRRAADKALWISRADLGGADYVPDYSHHPQPGSEMFWLPTGGNHRQRTRTCAGISRRKPVFILPPPVCSGFGCYRIILALREDEALSAMPRPVCTTSTGERARVLQ